MNVYRRNVAIFLRNAQKFFIGERIDKPGSFQLPQGGVEDSEELICAAKRELFEETGVHSIKYIGRTLSSYKYDFPKNSQVEFFEEHQTLNYIGQEQVFFLFDFEGNDSEINLNVYEQEFSSWKWADLDEILEKIVSFKRASYLNAINDLMCQRLIP